MPNEITVEDIDRSLDHELTQLGLEPWGILADHHARSAYTTAILSPDGLPDRRGWLLDYIRQNKGDFRKAAPPGEQAKEEPAPAPDPANPWVKGRHFNMTEQGRIANADPERAARLKAEAQEPSRAAMAEAEKLRAGRDNPWITGPGFNRTKQGAITNSNPELAEQMKNEARKYK